MRTTLHKILPVKCFKLNTRIRFMSVSGCEIHSLEQNDLWAVFSAQTKSSSCWAFTYLPCLPPPPPTGYIVFSGPRRANGVQGLRFIIQSEKAPHYLESRVEAFLCTMEKAVEEMNDEAFQKHIQALAIRRLDKPKKLSAECAKYWGEIISQQYNFDRGEVLVMSLLTVAVYGSGQALHFSKPLSGSTGWSEALVLHTKPDVL